MQQNETPSTKEAEAWKCMMNAMVTFISASTQLMQTLNNKLELKRPPPIQNAPASNEDTEVCFKECGICFEEKPKKTVCAANLAAQNVPSTAASVGQDVPNAPNAEQIVREELAKVVEKSVEPTTEEVLAEMQRKMSLCICEEMKMEQAKKLEATSKPMCACPMSSEEKRKIVVELRGKLKCTEEELKNMHKELARLEALTQSKQPGPNATTNTAALYQQIMKTASNPIPSQECFCAPNPTMPIPHPPFPVMSSPQPPYPMDFSNDMSSILPRRGYRPVPPSQYERTMPEIGPTNMTYVQPRAQPRPRPPIEFTNIEQRSRARPIKTQIKCPIKMGPRELFRSMDHDETSVYRETNTPAGTPPPCGRQLFPDPPSVYRETDTPPQPRFYELGSHQHHSTIYPGPTSFSMRTPINQMMQSTLSAQYPPFPSRNMPAPQSKPPMYAGTERGRATRTNNILNEGMMEDEPCNVVTCSNTACESLQ